jgi:uncharacterized membrane protein
MSRKISERVANVLRKVGDGVLNLRRLPSKVAHKPRKLVPTKAEAKREEVPARFKDFFERRQAGWPEYIMLKAQIAILALFAVSVTYIALARAQIMFLILISAFSAYAVYLALTQLKRAFKRDYPAYRGFVIMCIGIAWAFVLALGYLPGRFESAYTVTVPALIAVLFALLAFTAFRLKYGRNYTYGVVQGVSGGKAMVKVGYDLRSNVKSGVYTVDIFGDIEKGNTVKLSVERPMLGLRGAKLKAVLEKLS